jgi:simple sugar transport system permease protein
MIDLNALSSLGDTHSWALFIAPVLSSSTILALAGLGLLINEKAGVLNLGAEGMMLCAAVAAFAMTVSTGSSLLGHVAGMTVGALMAMLFGLMVIWLGSNQTATGLALSILGLGLSAFVGTSLVGKQINLQSHAPLPILSEIPFLGTAIFSQHPLVYFTIFLTVWLTWFFQRSRAGLIVRAVGESPQNAHSLGYNVRLIRLIAVCVGGALCGLAGSYLSLVFNPFWVEGMTAGKGWIALALTAFATWRPLRILLGSLLFGGVSMLSYHLQAQGVAIPSQFLTMLPYLTAIAALAIISYNPLWIRLNIPASLGKSFNPH